MKTHALSGYEFAQENTPMKKSLHVAVCGATGAVGREMLKTLAQRNFPAASITPLASARSAGTKVPYGDDELTVKEMTKDSFKGIDIAIFSAGGSASKEFAPYAVAAGCVVVDNSSAWRMDDRCPLVVPEVNPDALDKHNGIIANPNCSTIQMLVALKPLHDAATIKRIVVSTYQAVSGTGKKGLDELETQVRRLFNMQDIECNAYPHQIAFNCRPHIDVFMDNDYTKEEMKMYHETRKIMHEPEISVSAMCVRVPVMRAHSEAIWVETERKITPAEAREIFEKAEGVVVVDNPAEKEYPMPLFVADKDPVFVGRIREDLANENGLSFWLVGDQIKKGAALNAVQIAQYMIKHGWTSKLK